MAAIQDNAELAARGKAAAGNWRKFDSFSWWGRDDEAIPDPDAWTVVYTHNRDSGLLAQSNAAVIDKALEPFKSTPEGDHGDVHDEDHNHWACGWVKGYAIRVFRAGQVTEAFRTWCELQDRMEDYPILNEDDYSERETEATAENVKQQVEYVGRNYVLPDDAVSAVYDWLAENNESCLYNGGDDTGGYPDDEAIEAAFEALGYPRDE